MSWQSNARSRSISKRPPAPEQDERYGLSPEHPHRSRAVNLHFCLLLVVVLGMASGCCYHNGQKADAAYYLATSPDAFATKLEAYGSVRRGTRGYDYTLDFFALPDGRIQLRVVYWTPPEVEAWKEMAERIVEDVHAAEAIYYGFGGMAWRLQINVVGNGLEEWLDKLEFPPK